ncbi:MAG: Asp23/Gls24 family envelope stress response protein [Oscillospiraceae bacterium]|nr:Asp23/Gls24 family envelope stress response protein [Oscillospiraceae bacterium]
MAENREYMIRQEDMGNIQISEEVVANLATATALEVDGVSGLLGSNVSDLMGGKKMTAKGVRVEMDGEGLAVNLFLVIRYGCEISDVAAKVQEAVFTTLEGSTGFKVGTVNVHVGGISFN